MRQNKTEKTMEPCGRMAGREAAGHLSSDEETLLHAVCPLCGAVTPVAVTGAQLAELFLQDYPLQDIFPGRSRLETCMLLAGICPACWERILGIGLASEADLRLTEAGLESGARRRPPRLRSLKAKPRPARVPARDRMEAPRAALARKAAESRPPKPRDERYWKMRRKKQERSMWLRRQAALKAGLPDPYGGRKITPPGKGRPAGSSKRGPGRPKKGGSHEE